MSAYNYVERRMAQLSKELTGVVVPHDTLGTHLNGKKKIDEELEKKNFKGAGEVLANLWGKLVLDGQIEPVELDELCKPMRTNWKQVGGGGEGGDPLVMVA